MGLRVTVHLKNWIDFKRFSETLLFRPSDFLTY